MRRWLLLLVLLGAAGAGAYVLHERSQQAPPPPPDDVPVATDTFALLVGCTEYPELQAISDPDVYASTIRLLGPGNDAALLHDVLRAYLGVPEENVTVLTGWPDDPAARPTRANILGHLEALVRRVTAGAQVLFFFAGHGSQQPDGENADEADGQDEILLPADAGRWDPAIGGVAGVITDDEIQARLVALRDAGATVWALFDCCHSGTMMRGAAPELGANDDVPEGLRTRYLPPEILGIPPASGTATARGVEADAGGTVLSTPGLSLRGIGAIYAAHSWERAPEMVLPRSRLAADRENHGLCTFQVARTLQRYGRNLTLAEIHEHVRQAYAAMPWGDATPVAEGDLSLRVVPGAGPGGAALLLRREEGRLVLDAGSLRGLTAGSLLEVYRPGGFQDPSASLGRVTLEEVGPLTSICGTVPGGPDPSEIPEGAPAAVVQVAPGGPPLRLAWVDAAGEALPTPEADRRLERLFGDARARSPFLLVAPPSADWQVRDVEAASDDVRRIVLSPACGAAGAEPLEVVFDDLAAVLERVRRAETLRHYAKSGPLSALPDGLAVQAEVRRLGTGDVETLSPGDFVLPGDRILVRIANGTGHDVDVAVKNLDAWQHEYHVWPPDEPSRRLSREETAFVALDELELTDDGFGRESLLLVLAVRDPGALALDVGVLTGPAIGEAGEDIARRQGEYALLGALEPPGAQARSAEAVPTVSASIHEIAWTSAWGRFGYPSSLVAKMTALEPPVVASAAEEVEAPSHPGEVTWTHALVLPGGDEAADVLLLLGGAGGEGALAVLVDEDGDAALDEGEAGEAARRAAAGLLPTEIELVTVGSRAWATYPRDAGARERGGVRRTGERPERAAWRFDLVGGRWVGRETCGPLLSTALVPLPEADAPGRRRRMVLALRRFFRPP